MSALVAVLGPELEKTSRKRLASPDLREITNMYDLTPCHARGLEVNSLTGSPRDD